MKFISLGPPILATETSQIKVPLENIFQGITANDSFIFSRIGDSITCYSRRCDHNRGRLTLSGDKAICPLHGWQFDPVSGIYDDVQVQEIRTQSVLMGENINRSAYVYVYFRSV